jgi:hypothetical protein
MANKLADKHSILPGVPFSMNCLGPAWRICAAPIFSLLTADQTEMTAMSDPERLGLFHTFIKSEQRQKWDLTRHG